MRYVPWNIRSVWIVRYNDGKQYIHDLPVTGSNEREKWRNAYHLARLAKRRQLEGKDSFVDTRISFTNSRGFYV